MTGTSAPMEGGDGSISVSAWAKLQLLLFVNRSDEASPEKRKVKRISIVYGLSAGYLMVSGCEERRL